MHKRKPFAHEASCLLLLLIEVFKKGRRFIEVVYLFSSHQVLVSRVQHVLHQDCLASVSGIDMYETHCLNLKMRI
ncbi:hypothetical protein QSI_1477 [Clostridioides difficile P28]|nr:hypothetical protein QSI_1477 [Clostridioides difficile P28]